MFFSIVIPTRNRPHLLKSAIDSVLDQDFTDFELIISDNSSEQSSKETQELMSRYDDKRITYIRPSSELPMSDHWEWALKHTSGEYVSVLYDRAVYKRSALSEIHKEITAYDFPETVVFNRDFLMGDDPPYQLERHRHTDNVIWYKSDDVVDKFSKAIIPKFIPLLANSFSRNTLQEKMSATFERVCGGVLDPSNLFCFHTLDLVDEYLCIDKSFIIMHGEKYSNEKYGMLGKESETTKDFFKFLEKQNISRYTPIETGELFLPLPLNYIYTEYYLVMSYQTSGRFKEIDKGKLYNAIMNNLDNMDEMSPEIKNICKKAMEKFRIENEIPIYLSNDQTASGMIKRVNEVKNTLRRIARSTQCFISDKFNISPFGATSGKIADSAFLNVEEALEYDRIHPRYRSNN